MRIVRRVLDLSQMEIDSCSGLLRKHHVESTKILDECIYINTEASFISRDLRSSTLGHKVL